MEESQSTAIIAINTSEPRNKEIKRLNQYSRCSFLMVSGLSFQKNKSLETTAETTNSVKDILANQLQIDPDELNMKFGKAHRFPFFPDFSFCFKS